MSCRDSFEKKLKRSLWGSFTHQQMFVRDYLRGRDQKAKVARAVRVAKGKKDKSGHEEACLYVCRAGVVTLNLHPNDLQHAWQWGLDIEEPLTAVDVKEFTKSYACTDWRHSLVILPKTSEEREDLMELIKTTEDVAVAVVDRWTLRDLECFNGFHDVRRQAIARHEVDFAGYVRSPSSCGCGPACPGSGSDELSYDSSSSSSSSSSGNSSSSSGNGSGSCARGNTGEGSSTGDTAPSPCPSLGPVSSSTDDDKNSDEGSDARHSPTLTGGAIALRSPVGIRQQNKKNTITPGGSSSSTGRARRPSRDGPTSGPVDRGEKRTATAARGKAVRDFVSTRTAASRGGERSVHRSSRDQRFGADGGGIHEAVVPPRQARPSRRSSTTAVPSSDSSSAGSHGVSRGGSGVGTSPFVVRGVSSRAAGGRVRRDQEAPAVPATSRSATRTKRVSFASITSSSTTTSSDTGRSSSGSHNRTARQSAASKARMARFLPPKVDTGVRSVGTGGTCGVKEAASPRASGRSRAAGTSRREREPRTREAPQSAVRSALSASDVNISAVARMAAGVTTERGVSTTEGDRSRRGGASMVRQSVSDVGRSMSSPTGRVGHIACDDGDGGDGGMGSSALRGAPRTSNVGSFAVSSSVTTTDPARTTGGGAVVARVSSGREAMGSGGSNNQDPSSGEGGALLEPSRSRAPPAGGDGGACPGLTLADRSLIFGSETETEDTEDDSMRRNEEDVEVEGGDEGWKEGKEELHVSGRKTGSSQMDTSAIWYEQEVFRGGAVAAATTMAAPCDTAREEFPSSPSIRPTSHATTARASARLTNSDVWAATNQAAASGPPPFSPSSPVTPCDGMAGQMNAVPLAAAEPTRESWQSPASSARSYSPGSPRPSVGVSASPHGMAAPTGKEDSAAPAAGARQPKAATNAVPGVRRARRTRSSVRSSSSSASPPSFPLRSGPTAASAPAPVEMGDSVSKESSGLTEQSRGQDNDDTLKVARQVIERLLQEKDEAEQKMEEKIQMMLRKQSEALQSEERGLAERAAVQQRELVSQWSNAVHELTEQKAELEVALRQREEGEENNLQKTQEVLRHTEVELALAHERCDVLSQSVARETAAAQAAATREIQRAQEEAAEKLENQLKAVGDKAQEDVEYAQGRYDALVMSTARETVAERARARQELRATQDAAEESVQAMQDKAEEAIGRAQAISERVAREAADAKDREDRAATVARDDAARAEAKYDTLMTRMTEQLTKAHEAVRKVTEEKEKADSEGQQLAVKLEACVKSRDYAVAMLGRQGELKAKAVGEAEDLRQQLAAARSEHAAALADAREATAAFQREHQEALQRSSQETTEAQNVAEHAVILAEETQKRQADQQAAADAETRSLREQTAGLAERLGLLREQERVAATAASEHANMLGERVAMLGEDLDGMTARAAAAAARATAAEARAVAAEASTAAAVSRAEAAESRVAAVEPHAATSISRSQSVDIGETSNEAVGGTVDAELTTGALASAAEFRAASVSSRSHRGIVEESEGEDGESTSGEEPTVRPFAAADARAAAGSSRSHSSGAEEKQDETVRMIYDGAFNTTANDQVARVNRSVVSCAQAVDVVRVLTNRLNERGPEVAVNEISRSVARVIEIDGAAAAAGRMAAMGVRTVELGFESTGLRRVMFTTEGRSSDAAGAATREEKDEEDEDEEDEEEREVEDEQLHARRARARSSHLKADASRRETELDVSSQAVSEAEMARQEAEASLENTSSAGAAAATTAGTQGRGERRGQGSMMDLQEIEARAQRLRPLVAAGGEWLRLQRSDSGEGWHAEERGRSDGSSVQSLGQRVYSREGWRDGTDGPHRAEMERALHLMDDARAVVRVCARQWEARGFGRREDEVPRPA